MAFKDTACAVWGRSSPFRLGSKGALVQSAQAVYGATAPGARGWLVRKSVLPHDSTALRILTAAFLPLEA